MLQYRVENDLSTDDFINILDNSTLGERRPVDDPERISQMLKHANLIITARDGEKLVGVARSLTDFAFCFYIDNIEELE